MLKGHLVFPVLKDLLALKEPMVQQDPKETQDHLDHLVQQVLLGNFHYSPRISFSKEIHLRPTEDQSEMSEETPQMEKLNLVHRRIAMLT